MSSVVNALYELKYNPFEYGAYPKTIKGLLWGQELTGHNSVVGYKDRGTSDSGLNRFVENEASRYHIAYQAIQGLAGTRSDCSPTLLLQKYPQYLQPETFNI